MQPDESKHNPAAVSLGYLGGKAGTGKKKKRSAAHYKKIAALGVRARRAKQAERAEQESKKVSLK